MVEHAPRVAFDLHARHPLSGIDRAQGVIAIKPSGVSYDQLTPARMVLVDLVGSTPEFLAQFIQSEMTKLGRLIKLSDARID